MPPGIHYSRIESLETAPGFPDVHYTLKGKSGTLELKCQPLPTRCPFSEEKRGLRKTQRIWIRDELAAGGRVILVLQAKDDIFFLPGKYYAELDHLTVSEIAIRASLIWVVGAALQSGSLSEILMN